MMELADYNMDQELRDSKLIKPRFWDTHEYSGGVKHFRDMDYETLQWMVDNKFADLTERQNYSPTISRFLAFLDANPKFRAIGYVVDKGRSDYRLSVEGVTGEDLSATDLLVFADFAHGADEFDMTVPTLDEQHGTARAWWD